MGSPLCPGRRRARPASRSGPPDLLERAPQRGREAISPAAAPTARRSRRPLPCSATIAGSISTWAGSQVMAASEAQRQGPGRALEAALPRGRDRRPAGGRQRAGGQGRQSLDQPPDRRRATARGQRPQPRRHAQASGRKWLEEGKPSPTGRVTFTSWRLWKKGDPLVESGLLGPVTLQAAQRLAPPGKTAAAAINSLA